MHDIYCVGIYQQQQWPAEKFAWRNVNSNFADETNCRVE